jgi:hypothetical protein
VLLATIVVIALLSAALGPLLAKRRRSASDVVEPPSGPFERFDPSKLLYSIPTLNDSVPPADREADYTRESAAALLHEDDWRQEEFTAVANREFVREMLAQLSRHRAIHAQDIGFREVFVRQEPPTQLHTLGIRLDDVQAAVGSSVIPLYYLNNTPFTRVRGGFAVILDDVGYLYGQEADGLVGALGLGLVGSGLGDVAPLARFADRHGLLFVDWIRGIVIEPGDTDGYRQWLDAIIYRDPDPAI